MANHQNLLKVRLPMNNVDKESFIKSLPKVKLILGNGFDLRCGLYTKYSDFYCKYWKKFHYIKNLVKTFINSDMDFDSSNESLEDVNVWDVFFAINSSENPKDNMYRWCDIEFMIKDSLADTGTVFSTEDFFKYLFNRKSEINWPMVKRIIEHKSESEHDSQGYMASFVEYKMKQSKLGTKRFYSFLLNQLKEFEKEFGDFIYWQLHYGRHEEIHFGVINLNSLYIEKAKYTLDCLCNLKTTTIDTFNFSFIEDETIMPKINYINGSFKEPIFGVDSYFEPTDERYIFTKTSRRMESDMNNIGYLSADDFENVVIFGHSLNEADYSYFFPIFDKLNLLDLTSKGVVVFAYCIWDEEKESLIKSNLRDNISNMVYRYAIEKGIPNPKRTLDSLSIQKKIVVYVIPEFTDKLKYSKCRLDADWQRIYDEIKQFNEVHNEKPSND